MDNKTLWKAVLAELEIDTSKANYKMWLEPTVLLDVDVVDKKRQIAKIACRTLYQKNMVDARYYGQVKQALDRLTNKQNELVFSVKTDELKEAKVTGPLFEVEKEQEVAVSAYKTAVNRVKLRPDYTFDTFAVSSTNEMAHAAASAVSRAPGKAYHLLFLYGGVGVGKTHLMSAVGHEILRNNPETEMLFCSGEEFMNELVGAIQGKKTTHFKEKFRKIKVFLVDDIQFIAGKDAVQEEFFHTFNAIVQNQGQIVLTSDKLPEEMVLLEDRLRSRFEGGLTIDIQEPNFELRMAILSIKAQARGVKLPLDVARLIASKIKSTRKLEGFLVRLITQSNARNEQISLEVVEEILGLNQEGVETKRYVPPKEVIEATAGFYSLRPAALKGKRRTKELVAARHLAMYILREDLKVPLKEIGRVFGNRDHTTVMHAVEKISQQLKVSEQTRSGFAEIKKKILG